MNVDVIIAQAPPAIRAARKATSTIPIVMMYAGDVIKMGIATNVGRPGGNITGLSYDAGHEWAGKLMQLVREMLPRASRVACLWNMENDSHAPASPYRREVERVVPSLRLQLLNADVRTMEDVRHAIDRVRQERAEALYVSPDPFTIRNRREIMERSLRHRLPVVVGGDWGFEGAVLVYGPRTRHIPARAAEYIDRILRGTPPGDLPIEQPTEYDLIVNLKSAKTLGLTIPPSLLYRADRVIQ
jgi:putative ABC transport system substrate-binding protein